MLVESRGRSTSFTLECKMMPVRLRGLVYATYKVNVLNYPPDPPLLDNSCVGLDDATGDLDFDWVAPVDTGINFDYYVVYHSNSSGGPFVAIDTIWDYSTTSYSTSGSRRNK